MDTILFFHTSQRLAWRKELAGAYRFARARGWRVQVVDPPSGGGAPPVHRLAAFWNPAGCIAECSGRGGRLLSPDLFGDLPTVYLGSDPKTLPAGASYVSPAPGGVGELAAREFLKAGLRSFAFVAAAPGAPFWSRDREEEFARTLAMHGRRCATFRDPGGEEEGGADPGVRAASLGAWLRALPKPCGVLAENDYAAAEVLDLARRLRLRVPSSLAVVGADDDGELCENTRPALTSVALDFEWAGYRASEILDGMLRNPSAPPARETYPALGLMRRGSTPAGTGVPPRILDALAFIRDKACEGITAADVAARFRGSRRLAEMEFRRATGRAIYEEIERVRFERVELLLRDRSRGIGAIADLCGWRTEGALRAAFLKRYGVSMRVWRAAGGFPSSPGPSPWRRSRGR